MPIYEGYDGGVRHENCFPRDKAMKRIFYFIIPAFGGLLSCFPSSAQMRVRAPSAISRRVQPSQPARVRTIMALPHNWAIQSASVTQPCCGHVTVVHVVPTGHPASGNLRLVNAGNIESENEIPGLGFDFPHLAAISGHLHFNPAFEHNRFDMNDGSFAPIFWGENPGFPDFVDPSVIQQVQQEFQQQGQQQPQIIIIHQPAPVARERLAQVGVPGGLPDSATRSTATPLAPPVAPAPIRDAGEFIFVRRDGRILFGSVFFVSEGVLQYVTPEGIRHTVPVNELDTEATRMMNDSLGATVDLYK
jgi:hypothetical protein